MRSRRTDPGLRALQLRLSRMEQELAAMRGKLERLDEVGQSLRYGMAEAWAGAWRPKRDVRETNSQAGRVRKR